MEAMLEKSRSGTSSEDRSSSRSPMSWKRYAASMSCRHMQAHALQHSSLIVTHALHITYMTSSRAKLQPNAQRERS